MFVLVLAAAADETRQTITFLVACLIGIAVVLAILTIVFWFATRPQRGVVDAGGASADPGPTLLEASAGPPAGIEAVAEVEFGPDVEVAPEVEVAAAGSGPVSTTGATSTWDFVAAARQAEEGPRISRPVGLPSPRIAVASRTPSNDEGDDEGDELARARKKRERRGEAGLSDDAWASAMRAAFDKLDG